MLNINMDSWEDWETEEVEVIFVDDKTKEEQSKRLEERKLVEESDNALTNELFTDGQTKLIDNFVDDKKRPTEEDKHKMDFNTNKTNKTNNTNKTNKQSENEQKQKEASKASKMLKAMKQREREVFGEPEEDDEYADYDVYYH